MAFFSEGQNRAKLTVLYTLRCFRTPATREQIYTAFSAVDGTDYFTVCGLLSELEDEQYLLSVPVRGRQLICLTQKGLSICDTFETEIARSVRDELIGVTDEQREEVRRANCVTADAKPLPDGAWEMTFSIIEKDTVLFEMTVRTPDAASAAGAQRKWLNEADEIYPEIYARLIGEGGKEKRREK